MTISIRPGASALPKMSDCEYGTERLMVLCLYVIRIYSPAERAASVLKINAISTLVHTLRASLEALEHRRCNESDNVSTPG